MAKRSLLSRCPSYVAVRSCIGHLLLLLYWLCTKNSRTPSITTLIYILFNALYYCGHHQVYQITKCFEEGKLPQ